MDWIDLHSFITIAREKSISKASKKLHLTQPTLTSRLQKLEKQLGVHLLDRNWKGVKLTDHGAIFLIHAMKLDQDMQEAIEMVNPSRKFESFRDGNEVNRAGEKLKISLYRPLNSSFLAPVFTILNQNYPFLRYEVSSTYTNLILQLLEIGQIHMGITSYSDHRPDLKAIPIFQENMVLLTPNNDPEPVREDLNVQVLLKKPFILLHSGLPLSARMDRILIQLLGKMPKDIQKVHNINVIKDMVSIGLGYTILPSSYLMDSMNPAHFNPVNNASSRKSVAENGYRVISLGEQIPSETIYVVYSTAAQFHIPIGHIANHISSVIRTLSQFLNQPGQAHIFSPPSEGH